MLALRLSDKSCCNTSGVTLVSKDVFIVASNERCKLCWTGVIWVMLVVLIMDIYDSVALFESSVRRTVGGKFTPVREFLPGVRESVAIALVVLLANLFPLREEAANRLARSVGVRSYSSGLSISLSLAH